MTSQALYNKWRGQSFEDILGQDHITATLQNQIRMGRLGHAYLFTGLRGTGKTSMARILAKAINCVGGVENPPCNACPICQSLTAGRSLDLVEIDGASNRGIDEIRDLRERVNFAPSECRYKVYVIDEVHMLTKEAFNALLKTLEEPPAHVVFIMCTTEPQRLPDTVLSRCQRFDFRRGSLATIMAKLTRICEREGIRIQRDALEFIARRATGSYRDAESLLDQLSAYGEVEITLEQVQGLLGMASASLVAGLVRALVAGDVPAGLAAIGEAFDRGAEPRQLLADVLEHLRALMLLAVGGDTGLQTLPPEALEDLRALVAAPGFSLGRVVGAIRLFTEAGQTLRYASRPELPLELALVEAVMAGQAPGPGAEREGAPAPTAAAPAAGPAPSAPAARPTPGTRAAPAAAPPVAPAEAQDRPGQDRPGQDRPGQDRPVQERPAPRPQATPGEAPLTRRDQPPARVAEAAPPPVTPAAPEPHEEAAPVVAPARTLTLEWVTGYWQKMMQRMRSVNTQIQALLMSAQPIEVRADNTIVLGCEAEFHRDKLLQDSRRAVVEEVLSEVLGTPCTVTCVVSSSYRASRPVREATGDGRPAADLFEATNPRRAAEEKLLNHPAVKELERQGGVVRQVRLADDKATTEDDRGK